MDGPFQTCSDCGIFTQTVGSAPNRQFIIRWKTVYFNNAGNAEFEVILTEGSDTLSVIYGDTSGDNGLTAASGIQQDLNVFTSFSCFEATADTRPACGLHTNSLWESHADPDCDCNRDCDCNGARLRHCYPNSNTWSQVYSHTEATPHTTAAPVGRSGSEKMIID